MSLKTVIPVSIYFDCALFKQTVAGVATPLGIGVHVNIKGVHAPQYDLAMYVGEGTVSTGEYIALYYAMKQAYTIIQHYRAKNVDNLMVSIYGDSQFVIKSFTGEYKTRSDFMYYKKKVLKYHKSIEPYVRGVFWVPRESNKEADILSKKGIAHLYKKLNLVFNPITEKYEPLPKWKEPNQ